MNTNSDVAQAAGVVLNAALTKGGNEDDTEKFKRHSLVLPLLLNFPTLLQGYEGFQFPLLRLLEDGAAQEVIEQVYELDPTVLQDDLRALDCLSSALKFCQIETISFILERSAWHFGAPKQRYRLISTITRFLSRNYRRLERNRLVVVPGRPIPRTQEELLELLGAIFAFCPCQMFGASQRPPGREETPFHYALRYHSTSELMNYLIQEFPKDVDHLEIYNEIDGQQAQIISILLPQLKHLRLAPYPHFEIEGLSSATQLESLDLRFPQGYFDPTRTLTVIKGGLQSTLRTLQELKLIAFLSEDEDMNIAWFTVAEIVGMMSNLSKLELCLSNDDEDEDIFAREIGNIITLDTSIAFENALISKSRSLRSLAIGWYDSRLLHSLGKVVGRMPMLQHLNLGFHNPSPLITAVEDILPILASGPEHVELEYMVLTSQADLVPPQPTFSPNGFNHRLKSVELSYMISTQEGWDCICAGLAGIQTLTKIRNELESPKGQGKLDLTEGMIQLLQNAPLETFETGATSAKVDPDALSAALANNGTLRCLEFCYFRFEDKAKAASLFLEMLETNTTLQSFEGTNWPEDQDRKIDFQLRLNRAGRKKARDPSSTSQALIHLLAGVSGELGCDEHDEYVTSVQFGLLREMQGLWSGF